MGLPAPDRESESGARGAGSVPESSAEALPDNVRHLRPQPAPRLREWPITLVSLVLIVSLGITSADHFRRGAVLFSFGIALAFFLRLLLPERDAGLLAVRSRKVDLLVLGLLTLSVSVLSLTVPPPS